LVATGAFAAPAVMVRGAVAHPGAVDLAGFAPHPVSASFTTMHGTEAHLWAGPLLLEVVNAAGITDAPGKKTHLRHVLTASGKDGYGAALALGEIDPKGEAKTVIIATVQDGVPLAAPRLIIPGDKSMARCVHDLSEIDIN